MRKVHNMILWDRKPLKMPLSLFPAVPLKLGMQLPLIGVCVPGEIKFLFARGFHLEIAPGLGMGVCVRFSF